MSTLLEKGPDTCLFDADIAGWSFEEQGKLLQHDEEDNDIREEEESRGRGGGAEAEDEDLSMDNDDNDDYVGSSSSEEEEEEDASEGLSDDNRKIIPIEVQLDKRDASEDVPLL